MYKIIWIPNYLKSALALYLFLCNKFIWIPYYMYDLKSALALGLFLCNNFSFRPLHDTRTIGVRLIETLKSCV